MMLLFNIFIVVHRIVVDSRLYSVLLSACIEAKEYDTMRLVIFNLESTKLQPDIILQTIMVKAYSKLGHTESAIKLWYKVKVC